MTVQTAPAHRPASRQVKSPLAAHSHGTTVIARTQIDTPGTLKSPRDASIADFSDYLRTTNNRNGRPYEDATVENYVFAARALNRWMTAEGIDGDFTVADTAMLNRFLRDYFRQHGQGGTHSQQRNMRHLFSYLARETGHPHPYTDALHRYSEQKQRRPATLSADFIQDLLEVTGNGRARDFEGARDHAMIRILTEGIRRGELLGMTMSALPDDLIRNPVIRVVPLKGARASGQGRLVLLTPSSARAFAVYLRVRRSHRFADSDWVWLGTRNRGQFSTTGIRKMLIRRAAEAGYGQVTPHQFRHTFSHDWLVAGGSEGDLMRLNGWKTRAMIDRYTEDVADQRALQAKRRRGDLY